MEPCYISGSCHSALLCVSDVRRWYGTQVELILALRFGFRVLSVLVFLCFCVVLFTNILGAGLGCGLLLEIITVFAEWVSGRGLVGTRGLQMIPENAMLLLVLTPGVHTWGLSLALLH